MWGARDLGSLSRRLGRVWSTESWNMINIAKHHQNISKIKVKKLEHTWAICFIHSSKPLQELVKRPHVWLFFTEFRGNHHTKPLHLMGPLRIPPGTPPAHHFSFIPLCEPNFRREQQTMGRCRTLSPMLIDRDVKIIGFWIFGLGHQLHSCSLLKWQFAIIPDSQTKPYFLKSVDWVCEHRAHLLTCPRSSTLRA